VRRKGEGKKGTKNKREISNRIPGRRRITGGSLVSGCRRKRGEEKGKHELCGAG